MKRILVTGGAGYIGSHACKALAAKGFEPVAYDNLSRGNRWAVKWGPFEQGDIGDKNSLGAVLKKYRPAAVMHFAAFAYVGESVKSPLLYYRNNVAASIVMIETLNAFGAVPVVFSSSCATYGIPEILPIPESHPQRPVNPYGFGKLIIERMLAELDLASACRFVALRYFNAAGADPDGEIGEAHDPETHLIPLALAAARDGTQFEVFGNDYETADGTCVRDYIHVCDIADAHLRALDYLLAGGKSCALNLANARGYSVLEVIETARHVSGKTIRVAAAPRRPGDPPSLVGSADRARAILGWTPARSALKTQVGDAWNWIQIGNVASADSYSRPRLVPKS